MTIKKIYDTPKDWQSLPLHELCTLFPEADALDYENLLESMKLHGFLESDPIVLVDANPENPSEDWVVLDGRNRLVAATDAGLEPTFVWYDGDDPLAFVTSKNLDRRHLTTGQKAAVAAELANLRSGQNAYGDEMTQSEAAEKVGVGEATIRRFNYVNKHDPELAAKVKSGEVPLEAARTTIKKGIDDAKAGNLSVEDAMGSAVEQPKARLGDKKAKKAEVEREELMKEVENIVDVAIETTGIKANDKMRSAMIMCTTRGFTLGKQYSKK